jgi:hypothetical protein
MTANEPQRLKANLMELCPGTGVKIVLYDIPGTTESNAWSLNTWKIRFIFK